MERNNLKVFSYIVGPLIMVTICFLYVTSPVYDGYFVHHQPQHSAIFIRRDANIIPTITGKKLGDSLFGQGFAHCQDRQWQMEILRSRANGHLSKIYGKETLKLDITARLLGLSNVEENDIEEDIQELLEAYANGVNECVKSKKTLPLEYIVNRVEYRQWTAQDSLAIFRLLGYQLQNMNNIEDQVIADVIEKQQGKELAHDIFGNFSQQVKGGGSQFSSLSVKQLSSAYESIKAFTEQNTSSSWVIDGKYTSTGKPLLSSNLYSKNQIPSFYYSSHLVYQLPGRNVTVSGASVPGIPGILSGINDHLAWGLAGTSEKSSLFFEETLNENGSHYQRNGEWKKITMRSEQIQIKNSNPHDIEIRKSDKGQIINGDTFVKVNNLNQNLRSHFKMLEVQTIEQASQLIKEQTILQVGVLLATNDNKIGYVATSQDTKYDIINPSEGYIVIQSNNHSQSRLTQLIQERVQSGQKISTEYIKTIDGDVKDVAAESVTASIVNLYQENKQKFTFSNKTDEIINILNTWDFKLTKDSIAASVFSAILNSVKRQLLPQLRTSQELLNQKIDDFTLRQLNLWNLGEKLNADYCEQSSSINGNQKCLKVFFEAVNEASVFLNRVLGEKTALWNWGRLHQRIAEHIEFSKFSFLKSIFSQITSVNGNSRTVYYSPQAITEFSSFENLHSASYKAIYSLERSDPSYFLLGSGIQENIISSHYSDQLKLESKNEYIQIKRDLDKLRENNKETLLLIYDPNTDAQNVNEQTDNTIQQPIQNNEVKQQNQAEKGDI